MSHALYIIRGADGDWVKVGEPADPRELCKKPRGNGKGKGSGNKKMSLPACLPACLPARLRA